MGNSAPEVLGQVANGTYSSGDRGVALAVRKDTATALASADGKYAPQITDSAGRTHVVEGLIPGFEDNSAGVAKMEQRYSYTNITSATTTTVKSGAGFLHALIINKAVAAATITIYDNTAGSGTKIGTITFGAALLSDPPIQCIFNVSFTTGLTIVTSGATDITVSSR